MTKPSNTERPLTLTAVAFAVLLGCLTQPAEARIHIGGSVGKVLRHIDKEKNRAGKNLEEAVRVTGKTIERQAHSVGDAAKSAEKRVREGKPIDAVWHFHTDTLKATGKNALKATQESSALRMAGQIGATAAFGPAGAAGFSGAYAGFTTKDVGKGLKAGVIAGATSAASGAIGKAPVSSVGDAAAKAAASGTVGGVATAASGGKFEDGFPIAAATSTAQSIYEKTTKVNPDPRPGTEWVAKGDTRACQGIDSCRVVENADDMRGVDSRLKATGKFNPHVKELLQYREKHPIASIVKSPAYEGSFAMDMANKVPYVQAGSYFHDILMIKNEFVNVATIPPAMVFTGIAGGAGRDAALLKQAGEDDER